MGRGCGGLGMSDVSDPHEKTRARPLIFPSAVTDADLPVRRLTTTESITLLQALASVPNLGDSW
jgi:hypothetical protein